MDGRRGSGTAKLVGLMVAVAVVVIGGGALLASQFRPGSSTQEGGPPTTVRRVQTSPTIAPTIPVTTLPGNSGFSWSDHEEGEPLVWGQRLELQGQTPLVLVQHDDQVFLFTTPSLEVPGSGPPAGMSVWSSEDGMEWEHLSDFDTNFQVVSVFSTPFGMIAYGLDVTTRDGVVWRSSDGRSWDESVVSAGVRGTLRWFEAGVSTDDVIVITGGVEPDPGLVHSRVVAALQQNYGPSIQSFSWGEGVNWEAPGIDSSIIVMAPLYLPIHTTTPRELGLDAEDLRQPAVSRVVTVWVSSDGLTWAEVMPSEDWGRTHYTSLGLEGGILTYVNRMTDDPFATYYITTDGLTWEEVNDGEVRVTSVRRWEGGLMGWARYTENVTFSTDGTTWRDLNLWAIVRTGVQGWNKDAVDAAAAGIAVVARAVESFQVFGGVGPADWPPTEWTDGVTRVLVYHDRVEVHRSNARVLQLERGPTGDATSVRYDPASASLTFLDPVSGEDLVTLTFEELVRLGDGLRPTLPMSGQGFLFSSATDWRPPGVLDPERMPTEWTVMDLAKVTSGSATHVHVGADRVLLVVSSDDGQDTYVLTARIPPAP